MTVEVQYSLFILGIIILLCIYHIIPLIIETEQQHKITKKKQKVIFSNIYNYTNISQFVIRILKEENLYDSFIEEFNSQNGINKRKKNNLPIRLVDFISTIFSFTGCDNFFELLIDNSFVWKNTKDGYDFWKFKVDYLSETYGSKLTSMKFIK